MVSCRDCAYYDECEYGTLDDYETVEELKERCKDFTFEGGDEICF